MGIPGLLLALSETTERRHIKDYADKTVGIDISCWLHKGVYGCSDKICKGIPTTQYVDFCIKSIKVLQKYHITPLVVFDGGLLPAKAREEDSRRKRRAVAMQQALAAERNNDSRLARQYFVRAVDVTPWMCRQLMDKLDEMAVAYVVAPYEADAQLAFLARTGQVDAVLSEDSDLLPYGCGKVLYKWDKDSGYGDEIVLRRAMSKAIKLKMHNWTADQFLVMCIFAGCDYLPSLKGVAITKAYKLVNKYKTPNRILRQLRFEAKTRIPEGFLERFENTLLTFRHARVWDPCSERLVHLTSIPDALDPKKIDFLGPEIPRDIARKICHGKIDPLSRKPFAPDAVDQYNQTNSSNKVKETSTASHQSSRQFTIGRDLAGNVSQRPIYTSRIKTDSTPRWLSRKRSREPSTFPFQSYKRTFADNSASSRPEEPQAHQPAPGVSQAGMQRSDLGYPESDFRAQSDSKETKRSTYFSGRNGSQKQNILRREPKNVTMSGKCYPEEDGANVGKEVIHAPLPKENLHLINHSASDFRVDASACTSSVRSNERLIEVAHDPESQFSAFYHISSPKDNTRRNSNIKTNACLRDTVVPETPEHAWKKANKGPRRENDNISNPYVEENRRNYEFKANGGSRQTPDQRLSRFRQFFYGERS